PRRRHDRLVRHRAGTRRHRRCLLRGLRYRPRRIRRQFRRAPLRDRPHHRRGALARERASHRDFAAMTGPFGIETDLGRDRRAFLSSASGSIVAATAMAANWPLTAIAASMAPGAAWTSLNRVNAGPLSVQYAELGPRD